MHVADSDFRELTRGKDLSESGDMGPEVFEQIMREQIRLYTQAMILLFKLQSISIIFCLNAL